MNKKLSVLTMLLLSSFQYAMANEVIVSGVDKYSADNIKLLSKTNESNKINAMRLEALKETAATLGARAGFIDRNKKIMEALNKEEASSQYDKMFDFSKVTFVEFVNDDPSRRIYLIPPVLLISKDSYNQDNNDEVRVGDETYKIDKMARFSPVLPNWREYFTSKLDEVDLPHESLLPENDSEKVVWNEWLKSSYEAGVKQANENFDLNMARLEKDYNGLLQYTAAYKERKITKPIISKAELGVTGGGMEMILNDKVYRITDHSSLVPDTNKWKVQ